ncbi:hypothetical protein SAMN04488070_1578 [Pseudidiomarina maritima]|uniref:Coiled-coil protein n=1 Tax=Pseudidiomarina maritima TaxID=519453 RepID=A0A1I6H7I4_9GAMM|nr:hypothetical protein [Pseudidiomarina maritima]SFR50526.1 hypothetical protein SAMN04488070_1578 [Pseudidiomarina maritima]
MKIYFSDFFEVSPKDIEAYGAFDPSLINDLPLFIDPFLLFNSEKPEYQELHGNIIKYVAFLRDRSEEEGINEGLIKAWFLFPEVKQTWFGYSKIGNSGSGLGPKFAKSLNENLHTVFTNFGTEEITNGSHLEKLCLIRDGVGRDHISDFTTNLIKKFLLEYTQAFARDHIDARFLSTHIVEKVEFNYATRSWMARTFTLPTFQNDYVLLTPKDILTKDENWINKSDMIGDFRGVLESIPNDQLRAQLNDYLARMLPEDPNKKEFDAAVVKTIIKFPEYIDYFIKLKEENGDQAVKLSELKVSETEHLFIQKVKELVSTLEHDTPFYEKASNSLDAAYERVIFLKQMIENNDGYRFFYVKGDPIKREQDLQLLFKLTWFASDFDVNAEVNNGRGPVDFKVSNGSRDKSLVEFKLASNKKLKQNLKHQVEVYEAANGTHQSIKVILYFSDSELNKLIGIMKELELKEDKGLVLIDARPNKVSASNVTDMFENV